MSLKTFLSAAGADIKKVLNLEATVEPIAAIAATAAGQPAVAAGLTTLQGVITGVEGIYAQVNSESGTGAQKLATAVPLVMQAIQSSGFLNGKQISDVAKYDSAVTAWTSAFADMLNALSPTVVVSGKG